ncbi:MAG: hypothetical protein AB1473_17185 [Thermodesulfobacteriota bacterium]
MKLNARFALFISVLCLGFIYSLGTSFADDVPLPLRDFLQHPEVLGYGRAEILILNFFATVVIEYLVICAFLGWPEQAMIKLMFWVPLVNVITNPAAQIGALFFGKVMDSEALAWVMVCVVEFGVAAVEFGLLSRIFGYMYRQGVLHEPLTARRIILIVAVANMASFLLGFVGLLSLLIEMDPR